MAASRAEMELSKAETSVGEFEAVWIKWAKITIALLVLLMAYGVRLIIVALHGRTFRCEWGCAALHG
jgi:hypothetical protein